MKSRWDNCRHQHPGYNYRRSRRERKCLHSYFSCCSLSQLASLLLLRFRVPGQISSCDQAPPANHFSERCQKGAGDTVSNNVSRSIITQTEGVTAGDARHAFPNFQLFSNFYTLCDNSRFHLVMRCTDCARQGLSVCVELCEICVISYIVLK